MIKDISLRHKLIGGGIAAVLAPFLLTGAMVYFQLSKFLLEGTEDKSVHIVEDVSTRIQRRLERELTLASAIASDPDILGAIKIDDFSVAQKHLESIHGRIGNPSFSIFITDKFGINRADALFKQQIGLNFSDRRYFAKAKEGLASITGPIFPKGTATPGEVVLVAAAPIREKDNFYGIVALVFSTQFMVDVISQTKSGNTGYAYLINDKGLVLFHPNRDYILKRNILDEPGTERLREHIQKNNNGMIKYKLNGVEAIAGITRVDHTDWIVIFSQNRKEVMAPAHRILTMIFISGFLFMVSVILLIYFFSSRISSPIQKTMEMMSQVTRHSTEIILQIGTDRKIIHANPAFEKLTGYDVKNLEVDDLVTIPKNIPLHVVWESLEAGNSWSGKFVLKGKNEELITLEVILIPVGDRNESISGYLALGRDVSAELMYEKRVQQAQKLEAIGILAGGIAHDFNNILGGILGYAELSLMKSGSKKEVEKYIRQIISASARARDLVAQILTFSRKSEVELIPLNPKTILKEAFKLMRAATPAAIDLQLKINSDSIILADPIQIHQVVMNLITNAAQAIGDDSGRIILELEDFTVDEGFTKSHPNIKEGSHIIIRVSDSGSGIEPKILDHIFEPFFTTKGRGEGTGLGLSMVHGIINSLNGIITADSEAGVGTIFSIFIPAVGSEEDMEVLENGLIKGGTESIVVIDDESALTSIMESILTNLGYRVRSFSDGLEALEEIRKAPDAFDLMITDYSMPRITGLELVRELRKAGVSFPVVLTSGKVDEKLESEAGDMGIAKVMKKPLSTSQLSETIRGILD